jgi:hypothetical protein
VIKRISHGLWFDMNFIQLVVFSIPSPRLGDRKHKTRWIKIISNHKPWEILYIHHKQVIVVHYYIDRKGSLKIAKLNSSRMSYEVAVSLPLESILRMVFVNFMYSITFSFSPWMCIKIHLIQKHEKGMGSSAIILRQSERKFAF